VRDRWLDVLALSAVGAAVALLAGLLGAGGLQRFLQVSQWAIASAMIVAVAFIVKGAWGRFGAYFGVRHFFRYPPVWVAGLIGTGLLMLALGFSPNLRFNIQLADEFEGPLRVVSAALFGALVFVVGALSAVAGLRTTRTPQRSETSEELVPLHASWQRLKAWIQDDTPVTNPSDDAFGHLLIADRIARRLRARPAPPQVVVGALGTGKSSLRHLVDHFLQNDTDVHIVPVELWPFDTPTAAVEGVLRTLLAGVAKEVNVIAARGLPSQYVAAMGAAGGFASVLANLEARAATPFDVLKTINRIAETIDHRFVVWVEDLERFAGSATRDELLEHSQRLAPLRALLFGLSELKWISVVTATTDLYARFDTQKIARFVEELPLLEPVDAERILHAFRSECLARPFIDAAPKKLRAQFDALNNPSAHQAHELLGGKITSVTHAAISFCRTPRSLKQALRQVLSSWERLTGEIDFDDLLLMELLREAEPAVFALIRTHRIGLAGLDVMEDARKTAQKAFHEGLDGLGLDGLRRAAISQVIKSVFPSSGRDRRPQGLAIKRYWTRFLSLPAIPPDDSDQVVLRAMRSDDDAALMDMLEGPQSSQLAHFAHQLSPDRKLRLLVPLIRRRTSENPAGGGVPGQWLTGDPPGMLPLWRMLRARGVNDAVKGADIYRELTLALEVAIGNLHLVHELEYYFGSEREGDGPLYHDGLEEGRQLTAQLRGKVLELVVSTYCENPRKLVNALRGSPLWTMAGVIAGVHRIGLEKLAVPVSEWTKLAPTVIEAAALEPQVMLPQLAALVTREEDADDAERMSTAYKFDGERAKAWFSNESVILPLFEQLIVVDSNAQALVDAVRKAAEEWRRERHERPPT